LRLNPHPDVGQETSGVDQPIPGRFNTTRDGGTPLVTFLALIETDEFQFKGCVLFLVSSGSTFANKRPFITFFYINLYTGLSSFKCQFDSPSKNILTCIIESFFCRKFL